MPNIEPLDKQWKGKAWSDGERVTRMAGTGQFAGTMQEAVASLTYGYNSSTGIYTKIPVDPATGNLLVTNVGTTGGIGAPQPSDAKLLAWNFPPEFNSSSVANAVVSGTLLMVKILIPGAIAGVKNVCLHLSTSGATLTSNQNFVALYASDGSQLGVSADQTAVFTAAAGMKTIPVSGPGVTVNPPFCLVVVLYNGTTGPGWARGYNGAINGPMAVTDVFRWSGGLAPYTGLTSMPSSITPTANWTVPANMGAIWAALA